MTEWNCSECSSTDVEIKTWININDILNGNINYNKPNYIYRQAWNSLYEEILSKFGVPKRPPSMYSDIGTVIPSIKDCWCNDCEEHRELLADIPEIEHRL